MYLAIIYRKFELELGIDLCRATSVYLAIIQQVLSPCLDKEKGALMYGS